MFKKVPGAVILLGMVSFFNDVASEMLYPIMPIFLTQVLGAPVYVIGIIEGVAEGLSSFLKTFFGVWSDKLQRRKPFVFFGYLFSAVSKLIIATSAVWPQVFLGRVTDRFGKGLRTGARDAMLLAVSDQTNKGFIFGLHRSFDSAGAVVGPLIALVILQFFNSELRSVLFFAAIPSFIGLIFFLFIREVKKQVEVRNTSPSFSFKNLSLPFKQFLAVIAIFTLGNSSDAFLILRAKDLGLSLGLTIFAYVIYNFIYTIFSTPAGRAADIIGAKKVFLAGLAIFALVYVGFALAPGAGFVWPLFAIYGFYIAFTDGVSKAIVGAFIQKEEAGTAYGLLASVMGICTLIASILGGLLWSLVSPTATFLFGALSATVAFILFLAFGFHAKSKI